MLEVIMNKLGYVKKEIAENAEKRGLTHFLKLNKLRCIIRNGKATKEPAVFIVDKIEKVIYDNQINR